MLDQINTLDPNSLNGLKRLARDNSPEGVKAAAQQFEAMFLQIVLKSMRDAMPSEGMGNSETTRYYQGLHDQQMAGVMAQKGGFGLAQALERQLLGLALDKPPSYDIPMGAPAAPTTPAADLPKSSMSSAGGGVARNIAPPAPTPSPMANGAAASAGGPPQRFVDKLWPQAVTAAKTLGVPPHFLVGQAALETGWGRAEIRTASGEPSYNLFNIKAGAGWKGEVVEKSTIEYINGVPQKRVEKFRAYASYEEAFNDYARLIGQSPRYASVVGATDAAQFGKALQSSGYATDPSYADKLARVIGGKTMRQSLMASARTPSIS